MAIAVYLESPSYIWNGFILSSLRKELRARDLLVSSLSIMSMCFVCFIRRNVGYISFQRSDGNYVGRVSNIFIFSAKLFKLSSFLVSPVFEFKFALA